MRGDVRVMVPLLLLLCQERGNVFRGDDGEVLAELNAGRDGNVHVWVTRIRSRGSLDGSTVHNDNVHAYCALYISCPG